MLRAAPALALVLLAGPVLFGLTATVLPAFGFLPALGGDYFGLEEFRRVFGEPGILRSCLLSLIVGLATTAVSLALVAGFLASWSHTRAFGFFAHLLSPLLSVPHAAAAFGLAFLVAPSGWLLRLVSPEWTGFERPPDWLIIHDPMGLSLMLGLIAKEMPFLFLVALAALPQARPEANLRVAASLGYGRFAAFTHTVWPRVYPQIRLAVFAVIAYSSSVVDVAIILGPTQPATLAVRLVEWMSDADLARRLEASAGAILQLGVSALAILIWIACERLLAKLLGKLRCSGRRFRRDRIIRFAMAGLVGVSAVSVFGGLAVLCLWSFADLWPFPDAIPHELSLRNWQRQLPQIERPFWNTLAVGVAATGIAIVLALACLEREVRVGRTGGARALMVLYLPLIIPQAAFVFGLQLFFLFAGVGAHPAALVLAHLVFVLPYVFLSLSDPWRAFDPRFAAVAASLGATPDRIFWRVRLPMVLRPALVAAAVGFAVSVGQYLPTLLIGAGRWPTLTTEAVALASGGDRRLIGVYALLQLLLPLFGFLMATLIPAVLFSNRREMRTSAA